ncbi:MAG: Lrp/AsnC family transcriptional regulator [Pseudomonadota bacterium]
MDDLDRRLIAELRRDSRTPLSSLAAALGVTRATARARLTKLEESGEIVGYTLVMREDLEDRGMRGLTMLEIEGRGASRVVSQLSRRPGVDAVHSTNGRWDLIVEISAETPSDLDAVLNEIRMIEGVSRSETSLILSTKRLSKAPR